MKLFIHTSGQGRPLILLHGWGFQHQVWDPVAAALSQHYCVHQVDLPGYGNSDPLPAGNNSLLTQVTWLAEQLPTGIWLGWSLGGLLAQQLAVSYPDKVSALCLVASTPCFMQAKNWSHAMPADTLANFAQNLKTDYQATLLRFMSLQIKGSVDARVHLRKLRQDLSQSPPPSSATLENGLRLLQTSDLRAQLAHIACPVWLSLGERDTLVPVSVAQDWNRHGLTQLQSCIIDNGGHMPFLSHSGLWLEKLQVFLNDLQGA
ncbi:pimeloyl-ACP methyl ester esterase BioH [Candidatus Venteria ishoeyi]|uniref:pimeloyl-ACP methyl ester esterase BioH n=1 Tax=Candidatus Venteria ishoeyi TaxID=1899563 RepID=UPI0025A5C2C8|nr:pimeloyl-ACP methyl ester esterase BioH [Candidatus Venteria ishoeyi]MDM8545472.1 pimeloyl-ACP methyl ester esterase BioH [Candidatus Venteria ishoeyi]